ncbi:MAG: TRAP transporter TatT component family protein [Nitrospinota bacterium]
MPLCLIAFFLTSCSTDRIAVQSSISILKNTVIALNEEEDPDFAEKAIASRLKMVEGMIKTDPGNEELLLLAARGFCSYAFSFIEDNEKERAKIFYRRGLNYGLQILKADKSFEDSIKKGNESFKAALSDINNENLPALFWTAYCWGGLINLNRNSPEALIALPKVEKMMKRVLELNEGYYFSGAHLYFGVFYGSLPPMLGGKPEKSQFHFNKALEMTQRKFLMAHILYAKSYAIQTQNKTLFENLLKEVSDSLSDILPSQSLANELAKKRAQKLLQDINDYF